MSKEKSKPFPHVFCGKFVFYTPLCGSQAFPLKPIVKISKIRKINREDEKPFFMYLKEMLNNKVR